jgi:hypothetical protein
LPGSLGVVAERLSYVARLVRVHGGAAGVVTLAPVRRVEPANGLSDHPLTVARGWNPIPVSRQTKKPIGLNWQHRRLDITTAARAFNRPDMNVGVQSGPLSNGLTDVDLDCREAVLIGPMLLPASNNIFGRASKPRSHWLYGSTLAGKIDKACLQFRDIAPDGAVAGPMLLELKIGGGGKGTQSVFPGSIHPSGEAVAWDRNGALAAVDDDLLLRQVRRLAVAVLLARHWPAEDSHARHDAALTVGGFLARAGLNEDEAARILEAIAEAAGDEEEADRAQAGRDAVKNYANGSETRGLPKLMESFDEKVAKKAAEWLEYKGTTSGIFASSGAQQTNPPLEFVDPYDEFAGPPFPVEILPPVLAEFVETQRRASGVDVSGMAMAALAGTAGAIHAKTCVRVREDWFEKPILWIAMIGNSAVMKTHPIERAKAPYHAIDHERNQSWKAEVAALKQAETNDGKKNKVSLPPKPPRCIMMDVTPEKSAAILARKPCGSLMVYDELSGPLGGFERYQPGHSTRAFWLKCWDGGPHTKDRVGKGENDPEGEIFVENLALCVLGGIQPEKLVELGDLTSDGLLARFLPVLMRQAELGTECAEVTRAREKYEQLIRSIVDAPIRRYHSAEDAREIRDRVLEELHTLQKAEGFASALVSAIGKLRGYYARLCLVLQVAFDHDPAAPNQYGVPKLSEEHVQTWGPIDPNNHPGAERAVISRQTAEAVEKLLYKFLLPHIVAFYDIVVNGGQDREMIRQIANFILAADKDRLRPSDLTAGVRALRGQPEHKIREWAGRFCAMWWLDAEETIGMPPKAWHVIPGLRAYFAERRRRAQQARALAHAILKAGGTPADARAAVEALPKQGV